MGKRRLTYWAQTTLTLSGETSPPPPLVYSTLWKLQSERSLWLVDSVMMTPLALLWFWATSCHITAVILSVHRLLRHKQLGLFMFTVSSLISLFITDNLSLYVSVWRVTFTSEWRMFVQTFTISRSFIEQRFQKHKHKHIGVTAAFIHSDIYTKLRSVNWQTNLPVSILIIDFQFF